MVRSERASDGPASRDPHASGAGAAGGSARREYERRKAKRAADIRARHPRLGAAWLALSDDPQSTRAWASGARGEEALGARLDRLVSPSIAVLHDRRIPRTRANIDHLVMTPAGVYVVDAKRYVGQRPTRRVDGGFLRPRVEKLIVGGRDRTTLVDGVLGQVERVRTAIGDDTNVAGVLCFIEADWPLIGSFFSVRGVEVLAPRPLGKLLTAATGDADTRVLRDRLARAFPPA